MTGDRRASISVVVAAALVAVTTLVLAAFGALDYQSRRRDEWERLRRAVATEADQLGVGLEMPVWNIDRPQIDRVMEGLGPTTAVRAVSVTAAGRVHALARDAQWRMVPVAEVTPAPDDLVEERVI